MIASSFDVLPHKEAGPWEPVTILDTLWFACIVQASSNVLPFKEEHYYFQEPANLLSVNSCTYISLSLSINQSINQWSAKSSSLHGYLLLFVASDVLLSLLSLSQSKLSLELGRSDPRYELVQ